MRWFTVLAASAWIATLLLSGCVFQEVNRQIALNEQVVRFRGTVSAVEPAEGDLIVLLIRRSEGTSEIVDHFVRARDGGFYFAVNAPGTYAIAAFHDRNGDLNYDPDEPARDFDASTTFTVAAGQTIDGIALVIQPDERADVDGPVDILAMQARSLRDQVEVTLGQVTTLGEVVDLDDDRFGPDTGPMGLWRPFDFTLELRPGVFFLEEYDPDRVPVLFVHGAGGYPQEFSVLIDSLDRERFQPWFYFYASGAPLAVSSKHLSQLVVQLEARLGLDRLAIVAHSMGGLVARDFVLDHYAQTGRRTVRRLVSISTPWSGHAAAQKGVDRSPAVVPSWIDMAPDSEFLSQLFYADGEPGERRLRLPQHVDYHLIFGFRRASARFGPSDDGVVTVASELRPEAQEEASSQLGVDADHTGILRDAATAARLNTVLADAG